MESGNFLNHGERICVTFKNEPQVPTNPFAMMVGLYESSNDRYLRLRPDGMNFSIAIDWREIGPFIFVISTPPQIDKGSMGFQID